VADFLRKNWFLLGLLLVLCIGILAPGIGIFLSGKSYTSTFLVIIIFFNMGFTIPSEVILKGLEDFRLHIFTQVFIFLFCPLYFFASALAIRNYVSPEIMVGIYALACLPTTISTCVIFTQASGGNVPGTMFNSVLSNCIGIFLTPLLLSLFLNSSGHPFHAQDVVRVFANLGYSILLPLVVGQIARIFWKAFAEKHKKAMGTINNASILIIVLITISGTASKSNVLQKMGVGIVPILYIPVSYIILMSLAYWGARLLKFPHENIVSATYASPQKTLALGVPLLSTFFAGDPTLQVAAILPLLFYHPCQLFVSGLIKDFSFMKTRRAL
jgi:solute carrier family 10 (sodium/bile acid cotransporter), member 7